MKSKFSLIIFSSVFYFHPFTLATEPNLPSSPESSIEDEGVAVQPEKTKTGATGASRTTSVKAKNNPQSASSGKIKKPKKTGFLPICKMCFWVGGGGDYLLFNQKSLTHSKTIKYSSFGAPSLWADLRFKIYGPVGFRAEYQSQATGEIKADTIVLDSSKINWAITTVGFDYKFKQFFQFFGRPLIPSFLLAYQKHSMPFIFPIDDTHFNVKQFDFTTLSAGLYFDIFLAKSWYLLWTNRIQYPLTESKNISVHSGLSFDGTIGASYITPSGLVLALYWGGQYHSYKYKAQGDEGSYILMTSKLNALLGYYY